MSAFLTFSHLGNTLTLSNLTTLPAAPGRGSVVFKELKLSTQNLNQQDELTITASIHGEKIAHIFIESFLQDQDQLFGPVYREFLIAPSTKDVKGVVYPQWENEVEISHTLKLNLPVLTNGKQYSFGFATPEKYCISDDEKTYRLTGAYTFAGKEDTIQARVRFDAQGNSIGITAIPEKKGVSFPKNITPKEGDTFTPLVKRFQTAGTSVSEMGDGFVLADELEMAAPLKRLLQIPLVGKYFVGILVEDLDGNHYRQYAVVEVK